MARNPNDVGAPDTPAAGAGHQTPEQEAITRNDSGGRTDAERAKDREGLDHIPGSNPGGSSQGQSDRKPTSR